MIKVIWLVLESEGQTWDELTNYDDRLTFTDLEKQYLNTLSDEALRRRDS